MGKHLRHKKSGITIENGHPGCMWSILHVIRYNHWNSVKKKLPHRRHHIRRSSVGDASVSGADYFQDHNNADMDNSAVEENITQSTPAAKNSVRSRIRALIVEEISKKKGRHRRSATSPAQLVRTDSIHHLEVSDQETLAKINYGSPRNEQSNEPSSDTSTQDLLLSKPCEKTITVDERCQACDTMLSENNMGHNPVDECRKQVVEMHSLDQETVDKTRQAWEQQELLNANEFSADSSCQQSKEFLDALDMIYLNGEFFSKVLQDQGLPLAQHFHNQQTFRKNIKLTKSMSFPLTDMSDKDDSEPSKPKYKKHGISYPEKGKEKLKDGGQAQIPVASESIDFSRQNSMPSVVRVDGFVKPNQLMAEIADNSSPGSPHHLKTRGKNQVVIRRFKNLRQKIKHVIKESRNERYRIALDAIFHKVPRGPKFSKESKEIADQVVKDPALNGDGESPVSSYKNDGSVASSSKDRVREFRRTSSLNESLDRYCQLYESSCNRESKCDISEGVKMETKEADSPYIKPPKSLGRIASLPNLKCYRYQCEDSPGDVGADEQKSVDLSIDSESCSDIGLPHKSGTREILVDEVGEVNAGFDNQVKPTSLADHETTDNVSHHEQDIAHRSKPTTQLEEPTASSLISSILEDDTTNSANIYLSEEIEPRQFIPDELDVITNQLHKTPMETSTVTDFRIEFELEEIVIKKLNMDILHLEVDEKDKAEFNYVRDVLRISGFRGNEFHGTWHFDEQPVDPSVYEEVEGCLLLDPDCSGNEEGGNCNHLLLFDLINEVLVDIYLRSYTYCPVPLSSLCHIHPMPIGDRILKEVWENISWYLSSKAELDQSLDYLVTRDLAKGNGWMNLQFDTECVEIELEDLIFDDLIDEMLWTDLVDGSHLLF